MYLQLVSNLPSLIVIKGVRELPTLGEIGEPNPPI